MNMPQSIIITDLSAPEIYTGLGLPIFTLYQSPSDFPGKFVARLSDGMTSQATPFVFVSDKLSDVVKAVPQHFCYFPRHDSDDPVIVGVFL